MARARVPAIERAEAAMRACVEAGPSDAAARDRERARATGTLVTPGELAELMGEETVELAVVTYRFRAGGRIEPPLDVVVRCEPSALEGVYRSMAKLLESRRWSSEARVSRDRAAATEVEEMRRGSVG